MYVVIVRDADTGDKMTYTCHSVFGVGDCIDRFIQYITGDRSDKRILRDLVVDVDFVEEIKK